MGQPWSKSSGTEQADSSEMPQEQTTAEAVMSARPTNGRTSTSLKQTELSSHAHAGFLNGASGFQEARPGRIIELNDEPLVVGKSRGGQSLRAEYERAGGPDRDADDFLPPRHYE